MNVLKEKTACSVGAEPQSAHECASIIHINSITLAETKSKKNFYSIDGETLMSTPLPPIRFAISTLLPQGLSILAGAPKVGKRVRIRYRQAGYMTDDWWSEWADIMSYEDEDQLVVDARAYEEYLAFFNISDVCLDDIEGTGEFEVCFDEHGKYDEAANL